MLSVGSLDVGTSDKIALAGKYIYINDLLNGGFAVVDVSDPTTPLPADSSFSTDISDVEDLVIVENYLYIAGVEDNLTILNISDPLNPTEIETFALLKPKCKKSYFAKFKGFLLNLLGTQSYACCGPTGINSVAVSGQYIFMTSTTGDKLRVATDDTFPHDNLTSLTDYLLVSSVPVKLTLAGNYAYIASGSKGVEVFNISTPATPNQTDDPVLPTLSNSATNVTLAVSPGSSNIIYASIDCAGAQWCKTRLTAYVTDSSERPVENEAITITIPLNGGTVLNTTVYSDHNGNAVFVLTSGTAEDTFEYSVTANGHVSNTVSITIDPV